MDGIGTGKMAMPNMMAPYYGREKKSRMPASRGPAGARLGPVWGLLVNASDGHPANKGDDDGGDLGLGD